MNDQKSLIELFGDPIFTYTRANAIEDGILQVIPDDIARNHFKYPMAITNTLACLIEGPDYNGWLHDICHMARVGIVSRPNPSTVIFTVLLPLKVGSGTRKRYNLKCVVHPGDTWEPVITISFPNED